MSDENSTETKHDNGAASNVDRGVGRTLHTKQVRYMGMPMVLACDGMCSKAWGITERPKLQLSGDPDDGVYLADTELGDAPQNPGTYEGGHGKPNSPAGMNKWCARACERSDMAATEDKLTLPDYSVRLFNQPWKHEQTPNYGNEGREPPRGEASSA